MRIFLFQNLVWLSKLGLGYLKLRLFVTRCLPRDPAVVLGKTKNLRFVSGVMAMSMVYFLSNS